MGKYLAFILIIILTVSCHGTKVVKEETEYFSFERPVELALDTLIFFKNSSNVSAAQKAIGNDGYINTNIKGMFVIDGIAILFAVQNPESNDVVTCYCSDYTDEYLKRNRETISQNTHEYRIVEGKSRDTDKRWVELCIDMKHQFFAEEIDKDKFNQIKELLKTIKVHNK